MMSKATGFLVFASIVLAVTLYGMRPRQGELTVQALIEVQGKPVTSIDAPRFVIRSIPLGIESIHFPPSLLLRHARLGNIEMRSDFFIHFRTHFTVHQAGKYQFRVRSDDGFRLLIDGKKLSEFVGQREFRPTTASLHLASGQHEFELVYFQSQGLSGVEAEYWPLGSKKQYYVGESSLFLEFHPIVHFAAIQKELSKAAS